MKLPGLRLPGLPKRDPRDKARREPARAPGNRPRSRAQFNLRGRLVLVAVDFSATARHALAWAFDYALATDATIHTLHVVDRRQVRRTAFPYYLGDTASMNVLRRSFPGERNEERTVAFLDVATRRVTSIPLDGTSERPLWKRCGRTARNLRRRKSRR